MSFSPQWNEAHRNGRFSSLVMSGNLFVILNNLVGNIVGQRILDLGCGAADAAKWYTQNGAKYFGIDGSEAAISRADRVEGSEIAYADFTREIPFEGDFDIVIDRASVPHNDSEGIQRCVRLVRERLKPGGLMISSDWFSDKHSEFSDLTRGEIVDQFTRTNYPDGQFQGIGKVHFSGECELRALFEGFECAWLEERSSRRPARGSGKFLSNTGDFPNISPHYVDKEYVSAVWDFAVRKPR